MARIFITGSTDGIGFLAARQMLQDNHQVYLHARNEERAKEVNSKLQNAADVLIADLSRINEVKEFAAAMNDLGKFDAIIHNAGVNSVPGEEMFTVNVLAPYLLTALVEMPERLIYLSSSMHKGGRPLLDDSAIKSVSYSDSKLQVTMLMKAVARLYPNVYANAVDPGWVPTRMGGSGAPDDLQKGYETQVWLATSHDREALVSGRYFYHKKQQSARSETNDTKLQDILLQICQTKSGVEFS